MAVGRKRPPLCRGCAPATPPSKTIPRHRLTLFPKLSTIHRSAPPLAPIGMKSPPYPPHPHSHPIPRNQSIPGQTTLQSPHQPPSTRKSQPITKIPKITVQTKSPARPSPIPPPTPAHAQITVHHENPQNHSSDKVPGQTIPKPPHQPPHTRKSQPITKIPPNHSSDKIPARAQITAHHENPKNHSSDKIPPNPRTRANHSPSQKSLKSQFRQNPPQPPHTRKSQPITKIPRITVQTKSQKSQFRQNPRPNHSSDKIRPKTPKIRVIITNPYRCSLPARPNQPITIAGPPAAQPDTPVSQE